MKINARCGGCDRVLALSAEYAGKRIRCPKCDEIVSVPDNRQQAPRKRPAPAKAPRPKKPPQVPPPDPEPSIQPSGSLQSVKRFAIGALVGAILATVIVVIAWVAKRQTVRASSATPVAPAAGANP